MEPLFEARCKSIDQTDEYTLFLLEVGGKKIPVFTDVDAGDVIFTLQGKIKPKRPLPHHLIYTLLKTAQIKVMKTVLYDVEDDIILSKLFLMHNDAGKQKVLEIEARASDSLMIALSHDAPIYCSAEVIEKQSINS
jgi:bifunctional DNase/RNase